MTMIELLADNGSKAKKFFGPIRTRSVQMSPPLLMNNANLGSLQHDADEMNPTPPCPGGVSRSWFKQGIEKLNRDNINTIKNRAKKVPKIVSNPYNQLVENAYADVTGQSITPAKSKGINKAL